MKWEYIGSQDLPHRKGKPLFLHPEIWRSRVPGGWMILTITAGDVKAHSFYPDPDHIWEIDEEKMDKAASTLLRPAGQSPLIPEE